MHCRSSNIHAQQHYTVKKGYRFSRPQAWCHWTNSPWPGIIKFFPARESLVSDIPPADGKIDKLFLQCMPSMNGLWQPKLLCVVSNKAVFFLLQCWLRSNACSRCPAMVSSGVSSGPCFCLTTGSSNPVTSRPHFPSTSCSSHPSVIFSVLFSALLHLPPSDSNVPTDAGIEPRTDATGALTVRRSNH